MPPFFDCTEESLRSVYQSSFPFQLNGLLFLQFVSIPLLTLQKNEPRRLGLFAVAAAVEGRPHRAVLREHGQGRRGPAAAGSDCDPKGGG